MGDSMSSLFSLSDVSQVLQWGKKGLLTLLVLRLGHYILNRYVEWRKAKLKRNEYKRLPLSSREYIDDHDDPANGDSVEDSRTWKRDRNYFSILDSDHELGENQISTPLSPRSAGLTESQRDFLSKCQYLKSFLSNPGLRSLLESVEIRTFKKDQPIFSAGDPRDTFYVVKKGKLRIHPSGLSSSRSYILEKGHAPVGMLFVLMSALETAESEGPSGRCLHSSLAVCDSEECSLFAVPGKFLLDLTMKENILPQLARSSVLRIQKILLPTLRSVFGLSTELFSSPLWSDRLVAPSAYSPLLTDDSSSSEREAAKLEVALQALGLHRCADPEIYNKLRDVLGKHVEVVTKGEEVELDNSVYVVLDGEVEAYFMGKRGSSYRQRDSAEVFTAERGEVLVSLKAVTGAPGPFLFRCKSLATLLRIPGEAIKTMININPRVLLSCWSAAEARAGNFLHRLDAAVEWEGVGPGQHLCKPGDRPDGFHIVLSGRLFTLGTPRPSVMHPELERACPVEQTFTRGDIIGGKEYLTHSELRKRIVAVRDSELCRVTPALLGLIVAEFPQSLLYFAGKISEKATGYPQKSPSKPPPPRTICLLSTTDVPPLGYVSKKLARGFRSAGLVVRTVDSSFLQHQEMSSLGLQRLVHALGDVEEVCDLVLYVADPDPSEWTKVAVRQADVVLLCSWFAGSTELASVERFIPRNTSVELLLLHQSASQGAEGARGRGGKPDNYRRPRSATGYRAGGRKEVFNSEAEDSDDALAQRMASLPVMDNFDRVGTSTTAPADDHMGPGIRNFLKHQVRSSHRFLRGVAKSQNATRDFLACRPYVSRAHHIRLLPRDKGEEHQLTVGDWNRVARILCGRAVAVALGGGGARGCAHLGVLKALHEKNIPVDIVAGTSFGALVGALYALADSYDTLESQFGTVLNEVFSQTALMKDLTLPMSSYFTGNLLNRCLQHAFQNIHIEDLWVQFLCVSTDIINFDEKIHGEGLIWRAVRASMSLVGFVPPIPEGDSLLVDGGYSNNFPVEHCLAAGANVVICVDVGGENDPLDTTYGDSVSGFYQLIFASKFCPQSYRAPPAPTLRQIQERIMYLAEYFHNKKREESDAIDLLLVPPVKDVGTLEFQSFHPTAQRGYRYALEELQKFLESGTEAANFVADLAGGKLGLNAKPEFHLSMRRSKNSLNLSNLNMADSFKSISGFFGRREGNHRSRLRQASDFLGSMMTPRR